MWERRTFHECAEELGIVSADFRSAYTNRFDWDDATRNRVIRDTSRRGVEILRILTLAIRAEQDYGLIENGGSAVGALRADVPQGGTTAAVNAYQPPYSQFAESTPLGLREALNKIAHANPEGGSFRVGDDLHEIILSGADQRGREWIAVISLIDLCRVIKYLPDRNCSQRASTG